MELTEHRPADAYFIRRITEAGICVVDTTYATSLLVSLSRLDTDWPVASLEELDPEVLEPVWAMEPDLVILGTGRRQRFPTRDIQIEFLRRGIGLEAMTLDAAARTFNVVASEGRRAVAALIWETL